MGSDRSIRTRLVARCCYGASFGIGFVITVLTLAAMFWIAWCYFGLTIIQLSDSQRRGVPNYSYTTVKPSPSTSLPSRSTTLATEETSINSISKFPTTASVLRGSSRGESPVKVDKKKESTTATGLAKGDFASRDRSSHNSNAATISTQDTSTSLPPPRGPPKPKDEPRAIPEERASILSGSSTQDSEEDRIYARKVSPPGSENRPEEHSDPSRSNRRSPPETQPDSRLDISPTKVYDIDTISGSSRRSQEPEIERKSRDEDRVQPRDYVDRDKEVPLRREEISSSRRTNTESVYRDPDFDRDAPRRSSSNRDRDRTRYDDIDDERGSRSRYDKIDRGRESDDRYSKGDTRVYPDDRGSRPVDEDRYRDRSRDKYPDSSTRRGDDDRYEDRSRDYDERPSYRDRDPVTRSRVPEERPPVRDERYRDDDRYRSRQDDKRGSDDDRYRSRDEDRYRLRDDDRYRSRDDDRLGSRDDDRYRSRDDDRYRSREDDRYGPRDDDRYRSRDDDRLRSRDDDRYRSQDNDRYSSRADDSYRSREDRYESRDGYRYRTEDDDRRDSPSRRRDETSRSRPDLSSSRPVDVDVRESISRSRIDVATERKQSSRSGYDTRNDDMVSDYDVALRDRSRSHSRDEIIPSRISRPSHDDERVNDRDREENRRTYRYDDDERTISPTRAREEVPFSRSTLIDSRSKDKIDDGRYTDNQRDRIRDDRYSQDDRISRTRLNDRDEYKTKLSSERIDDTKYTDRREEVVLDHRSYGSEKDDEYRRSDSRRDPVYDDQIRRSSENSRRYNDDDRYPRRGSTADEEYQTSRTRPNYDDDRTRSRDTYDDDDRRYDDRYKSRNDGRSPPISDRKYDTNPDEDEPIRRRDPEESSMRKDDSIDRRDRLRPSASSRDEERPFSREEYPDSKSSSRRRYDDDLSVSDSRYKDDFSDDRRRSRQPVYSKDPIIGSSMTTVNSRVPSDVIIREKRYQTTEKRTQSSRVPAPDEIYKDRSYGEDEPESKSRDAQLRPLSAKDVIEAAIRHSDAPDHNVRKVYYPVFDPRVSNLTSPEVIRPSERRGTTITARKRRSIQSLDR